MNTKRVKALRQLSEIEKQVRQVRLAAEGWNQEWKTLIAVLMSARTRDKRTIPIASQFFSLYKDLKELDKISVKDVEKAIMGVNFYKTKAKNIKNLVRILLDEYDGKVPHDVSKLMTLPGVGRKTANVFLAEYGYQAIGVDTHVKRISQKLGWTRNENPNKIEHDLNELFPYEKWASINYILVKFGQTHTRKEEDEILAKIGAM